MSKLAIYCCATNNVRHLVLLLFIACSSFMFANLLLFNVDILDKKEYHWFVGFPVTYDHQTAPLPLTSKRFARHASNLSISDKTVFPTESEVILNVNDSVTQEIALEILKNTDTKPPLLKIADLVTTSPKRSDFSNKYAEIHSASIKPQTEKIHSSTKENIDSMIRVTKPTDKSISDKPIDHEVSINEASGSSIVRQLTHLLLWISPGMGMFICAIPSAWVLKEFGGRKVFSVMLLISTLSTLCLFFAVTLELNVLILSVLRFIQGAACSCILPLIGLVSANWGTLKEQFCYITWCNIFISMSPLISWPFFTTSLSFQSRYQYIVNSAFTAILSVIWLFFYRDRPQYHPWVNGLELNEIVAGKTKTVHSRSKDSESNGKLIKSLAVWAIWVAAFGYYTIISLIIQFLPIFSHTVVGKPLVDSVFFASTVFLLLLTVNLFHPLWKKIMDLFNVKNSVRVSNFVSFFMCTVICVLLAILSPTDKSYSITIYFASLLCCLFFSTYGFYRSAILVGRSYAQYIIANMQIFMGFAFVFSSAIVLIFVQSNKQYEWRIVYMLMAVILLITCSAFAIFGSSSAETWSKNGWEPTAARRMISLDQIDYRNDDCGMVEMKLLNQS